jgi:hypothetical protein
MTGNSFQIKASFLFVERILEAAFVTFLRLFLNGQNIADWFRQKYQEVKQTKEQRFRPIVTPNNKK